MAHTYEHRSRGGTAHRVSEPRRRGYLLATWVLLACFGLIGCDTLEYEPSGENVGDAAPPTTGITVDLAAGETITVWGQAVLRYTLDLGGKTFVGVEVYLDGELFGTSESQHSFSFASTQVPDGRYALRLVAYARSGTGSLADQLGAEVVVSEVVRTLVVDNAPPQAVRGLSAASVEGRLRLRWSPYPRTNFQAYHVYEIYSGQRRLRATLTDRTQVAWADPLFTGGNIRYVVAVEAAGGVAESEEVVVSVPPAAMLGFESLGEEGIRLTWSASPFPANVARYVLERRPDVAGALWEDAAVIPGARDTVYVDTVGEVFAARYVYRVRTEPFEAGVVQTETLLTAWSGDRLGVTGVVSLHASDGFAAYAPRADGLGADLVRIEAASFEIVADRPISVFGNSSVFATRDGARLFTISNGVVQEHDPRSLAVVRSLDLNALLGYQARPYTVVAADDGRLFFSRVELRDGTLYSGIGVDVVDFETGTFVGSIRPPRGLALIDASANGRYALIAGSESALYEVNEAGTFRRIGPVSETSRFLGHGDEVASFSGSVVQVLEAATLNVVRTFPMSTDFYRLLVDPATGYVAGYRDAPYGQAETTVSVYDPATGAEVTQIRAAALFESYQLQGNTLWGSGFYRRLGANRTGRSR
jgi:hypothetical protein